jgi:hypothetical protein
MDYNKYFDHHSEDYDPQAVYNGMDANDYAFEKAIREFENKYNN